MERPDNKAFCILPFVHLYSEPKGEVKPCCIAAGFRDPINLKELTVEEAFNSEQMKELRKDMINGKRNRICSVCYKKEDAGESSPRNSFNDNTLWEYPEINDDYSVEPQIQHIDIRFSNLCNFKCRMCSHEFSSNWYEDNEKIFKNSTLDKPKVLKIKDNIIDELIPHLQKIKSVYFAGGEPLIMPEHYKLLKYLYDTLEVVETNDIDGTTRLSRNLSIHYNTNLSVIKYNEEDLVELWKGFYRVFLSISCDGIGKVGEYQRTGFNHDIFIHNMNTIKKYFEPCSARGVGSGLLYNFQYTTTIWNVYHIFDFIKFMEDNEFITNTTQIWFTYAWVPQHVALNNLPNDEKNKIIDFLEKGLTNVKHIQTKNEIKDIINFIKTETNINEPNLTPFQVVAGYTKELDNILDTNVSDITDLDFDKMSKTQSYQSKTI